MAIVLISLFALLVVIYLALGTPRVEVRRSSGIEGIDDREAAQAYDKVSQWPQFRFLRHLIAYRLGKHQPEGILADIGCGPGYLANLIAEQRPGLQIIGVDASEEMIRSAEANAAKKGLSDRVQFRQGDVARLPFEDAELDFAISTLSLHHWSDPGSAFEELHRVLRPGGRLMLFDLRRDARRRYYWALIFVQAVIVPSDLPRINEPMGSLQSSYTVMETESMLRNAPFEEWRVDGGEMWMFAWARKRVDA
jgi:ubiquinone/menaquinone biosynthesis C-methylase UbiE